MKGEMTKVAYEEHMTMEELYQSNPSIFSLSNDTKDEFDTFMTENLRVKFENNHWQKYQNLCDYDTEIVPVQGGKRQIVICAITPKGNLLESNKVYVFAHPGGGIMFDMEMFLLEGFRTAVLFKTKVIFVDYWKDNIKAPRGSKDFAEVIEYINNNSLKFGIHRDHITVGGAAAGAWIVLGALHELVTRKNIKIIEAAFLISPIVDDVLSKKDSKQVSYYEEKWVKYNKGFFQLMAKDYDGQQKDTGLYPIRNSIKSISEFPPCVIFTSEYDCMKQEAYALKDMLQKRGKVKDFHEMPGVGHLYYYDCNNPESYWFFRDYTSAFEKYVKKDDEMKELEASFKRKATKKLDD